MLRSKKGKGMLCQTAATETALVHLKPDIPILK